MKTMRLALSFVVLAGLSTACAASPHGDAAASRVEATAARTPGEARIGDRTTCPVSGEEFIVSASSPKTEYEGKTYYFCCADCAKRFEAEPARYLKTSVEPPTHPAEPASPPIEPTSQTPEP